MHGWNEDEMHTSLASEELLQNSWCQIIPSFFLNVLSLIRRITYGTNNSIVCF